MRTINSNDTAHLWAEKQAASEGEAFEKALKREKPFEVDDKYEQAWRAGYKAAEDRIIKVMEVPTRAAAKLMQENAELKEQIKKLRECIIRNTEEEYD